MTIACAIFPGRRGIFPVIEHAYAGSMRERLYGSTFAPNLLLAPHMHPVDVAETARQAESGSAPESSDLNHDGRVDRADADALAMSAVALPQEIVR